MFIVLRSLYYLFVPSALKFTSPSIDENGDRVAQGSQELSDKEKSWIKKKVNSDFQKYLLYGLFIFIGIIILTIMFSSS